MPNVHGIEFNANQSELVKDLIRELLKDGDCAVYAVPNMKPDGELRMASRPATSYPRRTGGGVFLRIKPGVREAMAIRPMNAKAGDKYTRIAKISQAELLAVVRIWRKETNSLPVQQDPDLAGARKTRLVTT
jgi:hypothetical protein